MFISYPINALALQVKLNTQVKQKETRHLEFQPRRAFLHVRMYTDFLLSLSHTSRYFLSKKCITPDTELWDLPGLSPHTVRYWVSFRVTEGSFTT